MSNQDKYVIAFVETIIIYVGLYFEGRVTSLPVSLLCFDASAASFQAQRRKRRRRRGGGETHWTLRNNGSSSRVGGVFFRGEGSRISVDRISLCVALRNSPSAPVAASAATNPRLLAASEQFSLSNEWSCFLPCWNTSLLWEPRKSMTLISLSILCLDSLECAEGAGQRAWFPKRINSSLHSRCVYTHTHTDILYRNRVFDQCFYAAFVHHCGRQMVRGRIEFVRRLMKLMRSPVWRAACWSLLSACRCTGRLSARRDVPHGDGDRGVSLISYK